MKKNGGIPDELESVVLELGFRGILSMAKRVVFFGVRRFLNRNKRITTIVTRNRCPYEKLKDVTASEEIAARDPKKNPQEVVPPKPPRIRSRVKIMVRKVRDSMRRFRETARASNVHVCDLFPGARMLAPVRNTRDQFYPSQAPYIRRRTSRSPKEQ